MKYLYSTLLIILLGAAAWFSASAEDHGDSKQTADGNNPRSYLEIYKEFDGKCQGLRRGDIRMLRNTHPDKAIEFRMIRLLGGHRQASLIQDVIQPGSEGQKLGCEMLDDREQTWKIVRARFVETQTDKGK